MVETSPAPPFELSEAEFTLQFFVVALDTPAQLDDVNESFERHIFGQGGEPVLCRLRVALGPFDHQPFDRMWRGAVVVARRRPETNRGKA